MGEPAEEEAAGDADDGSDKNVSKVVSAYEDSADCYKCSPTESDPSVGLDDIFVTEAAASCRADSIAWLERQFESEPGTSCNSE